MKNCKWLLWLMLACVPFRAAQAQVHSELAMPPNGDNERAEISQWIGLVKVTIDYHSPNVHGGGGADRTGHIWGELVSYGFTDQGFGPSHSAPWRVGANETTTLTVSLDVKIEGTDLKAGTYGVFLDAEKSGPWTWIFSKAAKGWAATSMTQRMTCCAWRSSRRMRDSRAVPRGYGRRRTSTLAYLQWEKKRIPFKIEVPNVNQARAYTALGDKPNAIRNWEITIANVPENRKFMMAQFPAALKKVKASN